MSDSPDRYVGIPELVRYSSLSERTLRRLLHDRTHPIPAHRVGGRVLVKLSAFDAWLDEHTQQQRRAGDDEKDAIVAAIVRGARR